jgi:hypothetical protein
MPRAQWGDGTLAAQGKFARIRRRAVLLAGTGACMMMAGGAHAYQTTIDGWEVSLDTTLSSSVDIRTSNIDYSFVGKANGGTFALPNSDNGDLNFKPGTPVAALQRITTEFQAKRDDYGIFVRATGFYDPVIDSEQTAFQPLTRAAVRDIGADLRLLDAFAFFSPDVLGHRFDVRVGSQALNWGESSFIPFGINSLEAFDLTALHEPGSQLQNAILPIPAVDLKTQLTSNISLEGFWQFAWTRDRVDPKGSFFGTNDTLTDGGNVGLLFDNFADSKSSINGLEGLYDPLGAALGRTEDRHPTSLDEFGFALRTTVAALGDAEFGLYFENYHSRIPFGSDITGSKSSVLPSVFSALGIGNAPSYTSTASYFADYPKDIHLIGASWNFEAPAGIAVQGEISNRLNQPIQLAASDVALAVNAPAVCYLGEALGPILGAQAINVCNQAKADPTITALGGVAGFTQTIDGWKRYPVTQIQTTFTKLFAAPTSYINSIALVGEIGFDYVHDFPKQRGIFNTFDSTDTNSAFEHGAAVNAGALQNGGKGPGVYPLSTEGLATQFSGGYVMLAIFDMPNVLPYGIGMKPQLSLQHGVIGTSPYGVNTWQENTAAASMGVTFDYLQAWSLGMQYTNHFPLFDSGKYYGLIDRDYFSTTLSYRF